MTECKNEKAINLIWTILHSYAEDSLGNRIGLEPEKKYDDEYAPEWAEICKAMSHINECGQQLNICIDHLLRVCQHADEDCPSEYRSKWFNSSIRGAYDFLDSLYEKEVKEG